MTAVLPRSERITALEVHDVRFPTSRLLDGSDAMNVDPDYSAAYVVLRTGDSDGSAEGSAEGPAGHALVFTTGRGNDVQAAAIAALEPHVVGLPLIEVTGDLGGFSRRLVHDPQLRWLGPEKGVMHMAIGAVVNAAWDLAAKRAGLPVWQFVAGMTPEQIVDLIDFRYLADALTPEQALAVLRRAEPGRAERVDQLLRVGYPAYTTSPGWLGYSDEKLVRLAKEAVADGFTQIKLKVGGDLQDDRRRLELARSAVGHDIRIAIDANQRWEVGEAIDWIRALAPFDPHWVEEPTSPDDVLGYATIRQAVHPIKVAGGEHAANRIMFKQFLLSRGIDIVQLDSARVGGLNENLAILLLAAHHGVPVCPHAGGVGLCEMVQHLSMIDFVAVSGTTEERVLEYVDHLHEHFVTPVEIRAGHYVAPTAPGLTSQMHEDSLRRFAFPDGPEWRGADA